MDTEEKRILKELVSRGIPQSGSSFINVISRRNEHAIQALTLGGYIETIPVERLGQKHDFFRPTQKGIAKSKGGLKWFWYNIQGDMRNIVVSSITALIITFLIKIIEKSFSN